MIIKPIYTQLNSDHSNSEKRSLLISYLKEQIESLSQQNDERTKVAYEIAGLMSTRYIKSLNSDDILEQILSLAGELEIKESASEQKWHALQRMVAQL